jgi:hypothetical protein
MPGNRPCKGAALDILLPPLAWRGRAGNAEPDADVVTRARPAGAREPTLAPHGPADQPDPQVHALEWESRFLVDPGGFEDLARALTVAYTPYHADDALRRLAWLLNVRLTGHSYEAFRGWGLAEELGIERYRGGQLAVAAAGVV